jgi:hypothetical protein
VPRWLSIALLISVPCFLALIAYDAVAIFLLRRGPNKLVPFHDLFRGITQDFGLAVVYAVTMTPRISALVTGYRPRARHLSLIMLGLGLAWYDVMCAAGTRLIGKPPGLEISLIVLFVIPIVLAPWYVRWLKARVDRADRQGSEQETIER